MDSLNGRLLRARTAIALDHPYLANATMRLPLIAARERDWCPTFATDGYYIFYNPAWADALPPAELSGVIAHEVLHCVFGHSDRRGGRDPAVWNIATDFAINGLLSQQGFELPAGGLIEPAYAFMAAEDIYLELLSTVDENEALGGNKPFPDFHLAPDDPRCADLRGPLPEDRPDSEQRRQLRRDFVRQLRAELSGTVAGRLHEELDRAIVQRLDWRALLRAHLTERVLSDWRTYPFSKRHVARGVYMPSIGVEGPGHILFAVDTSASMTNEDLRAAFSEVESLRSSFPCRLTLMQVDTEIASVTEFSAEETAEFPSACIRVFGRGGTDFRPVFRWARDHLDSGVGSLIVYVTDGFGPFPQTTEHPVYWIVTQDGMTDEQFPFGSVIRLPA